MPSPEEGKQEQEEAAALDARQGSERVVTIDDPFNLDSLVGPVPMGEDEKEREQQGLEAQAKPQKKANELAFSFPHEQPASCSSSEAMGRNAEVDSNASQPPPSYLDVVRDESLAVAEQENQERQWAELSGPYQGVLDGMTLAEFQAVEKHELDVFFKEANVLFRTMGKFRLLHKGGQF